MALTINSAICAHRSHAAIDAVLSVECIESCSKSTESCCCWLWRSVNRRAILTDTDNTSVWLSHWLAYWTQCGTRSLWRRPQRRPQRAVMSRAVTSMPRWHANHSTGYTITSTTLNTLWWRHRSVLPQHRWRQSAVHRSRFSRRRRTTCCFIVSSATSIAVSMTTRHSSVTWPPPRRHFVTSSAPAWRHRSRRKWRSGWSDQWTRSWCGHVDSGDEWHRTTQRCTTRRSPSVWERTGSCCRTPRNGLSSTRQNAFEHYTW